MTFDDTDPRVIFSGNWTSFSDPASSGGSVKYAGNPGASASVSFTGTFVNLVYMKQANTGVVTILIDGALVDQLDTYAPSRQSARTKTYLLTTGGTHTITVSVSGAENPSSTGAFVIFDAFVAEGASS